ncbi:MAG: FAD-dependent oxidoreductase [Verrucomicrobia bacterium]|nr:FAD-dependent oxidoreductase [Verrucomicrobiota bacterium]
MPAAVNFPILILGGGFAGSYCARALASKLGTEAAKNVALLADQNVMLFHPMLAEVSGSSIPPGDVVNPLRIFCRGNSIIYGHVRDIDLEQKVVTFSPGSHVSDAQIGFEHLVLTLGSVVDVSRVPGMAEHGYLMKNVGDAMRLRSDILLLMEQASTQHDPAVRKRLLTFVVVGGGYSGVETMGQLVDLAHGVRRLYPRIEAGDFRFVLVQSGPFLLPQIGEDLGRYCERKLKERGVEILLNTRVSAVTAQRAIISQDLSIETSTVVTTVGNTANPVIKRFIDRYKIPNDHGRIHTDMTMLVQGQSFVWACGDCAAVPQANGEASPATAQFAMRQGARLGLNLLAVRAGQKPTAFHYTTLGEMASLGHMNAVGKVFGMKVSGFLAWLMWRATYLSKLPGLERKAKVFIQWNLDALFPRDISLLDVRMTPTAARMHLEKDDPVYHRGDPSFSFYLIEKGRVAISDGKDILATLQPGQHFGEHELLKNERRQFDTFAVEPSTLVVLDRNTFEALAQNSFALGYMLTRSSVRYLSTDERKAVVEGVDRAILDRDVASFLRRDHTYIQDSVTIQEALRAFQEAQSSLLAVVDKERKPKGWLRLDVVFDRLHQGSIRLNTLVKDSLILPIEITRGHDKIEEVLLRFAGTPDRAFAVVDEEGAVCGIVALLDIVLAASPSDQKEQVVASA